MNGPTVDGLKLDLLPTMRDAKGALTVAEFDKFVPFPVVRMFYVREVPPDTIRGQHAHRNCSQYMICIEGRVHMSVTDGSSERDFELFPGHGIHVEPGIFATETYLRPGTILLVLCDRPYERDDYIHTMSDFLEYRRQKNPT